MKFHYTIIAFREKLANLAKVNLTEADIDAFYTKVNSYSFRFSMFGNYYKKYIENLNRFRPEAVNNFDITFLKIAIAEDKWKPTKPFSVFVYHVQYKYSLTSKFYISLQKKQNHKKLNAPGAIANQGSKFDASKKWTRIPIRGNQCKPNCGCTE